MRSSSRQPLLADAWTLAVVLLLTGPMWLRPGYGLARDLLFTPRLPWSWDVVGMGTSLPRAVPLDAVVAGLTSVVDGAVVFRVAVAGTLLLAGCGAHRLLPDLPLAARLAVASFAVWNPYVVERLALGQWALLLAYAALWWLLPLWRRGLAEGAPLAATLPLLALGALTPTGGTLLLLAALASVLAHGRRAPRRAALVVGSAVLAQLPWLLPSLLGGHDATSDPGGVAAFASRAERVGGVLPSLLGTGGVWNRFVVPASQQTAFGHLLTAAVVGAVVVGGLRLRRRHPELLGLAALGLLLAALAALPGGTALLRLLVEQVPGGGLLRDGQKWLAAYVVLAGAGLATATAAVLRRIPDRSLAPVAGVLLALLPLALLPDAPRETWTALRPVSYPDDVRRAVAALHGPGGDAVVTLPYASYRDFPWGNDLSAADPLPRWSASPVVTSDVLLTRGGPLAGEDPRARAVGEALRSADPPTALADEGVGWVWVWRGTGPTPAWVAGLPVAAAGEHVLLVRLPGDVSAVASPSGPLARGVIATVDGLWLVLVLGAAARAVTSRRSARRGPRRAPADSGAEAP